MSDSDSSSDDEDNYSSEEEHNNETISVLGYNEGTLMIQYTSIEINHKMYRYIYKKYSQKNMFHRFKNRIKYNEIIVIIQKLVMNEKNDTL